jgi:hypothetical protein
LSTFAQTLAAYSDLTPSEASLLRLLRDSTVEGITDVCRIAVKELARLARLSYGHTRRLLYGLEAKGWLQRGYHNTRRVIFRFDSPVNDDRAQRAPTITVIGDEGCAQRAPTITARAASPPLNQSSAPVSMGHRPFSINTNTVDDGCDWPAEGPEPDPVQPPHRGMVATLAASIRATTTTVQKAFGQKTAEPQPVSKPAPAPEARTAEQQAEIDRLVAEFDHELDYGKRAILQGQLMDLGCDTKGQPKKQPNPTFRPRQTTTQAVPVPAVPIAPPEPAVKAPDCPVAPPATVSASDAMAECNRLMADLETAGKVVDEARDEMADRVVALVRIRLGDSDDQWLYRYNGFWNVLVSGEFSRKKIEKNIEFVIAEDRRGKLRSAGAKFTSFYPANAATGGGR